MNQYNVIESVVNFNDADNYVKPAMREPHEIKRVLQKLGVVITYVLYKIMQVQVERGEIQVSDDESLPKNLIVKGEIVRKNVWNAILSQLVKFEKTRKADTINLKDAFDIGRYSGKANGLCWVLGCEWDGELLSLSRSTDQYDHSESDSPCYTVDEFRTDYMIDRKILKLTDQVWYNNHMIMLEKIEGGLIKIIEPTYYHKSSKHTETIRRDILNNALQTAKDMKLMYGEDSLGPWSEREWGALNGNLSALRWVVGEEWDQVDI